MLYQRVAILMTLTSKFFHINYSLTLHMKTQKNYIITRAFEVKLEIKKIIGKMHIIPASMCA